MERKIEIELRKSLLSVRLDNDKKFLANKEEEGNKKGYYWKKKNYLLFCSILLKFAPSVLLWAGPVSDFFRKNWERLLLDWYTGTYININFWLVAVMGKLPSNSSALPHFFSKFEYARWGSINTDDVNKVKGSDVERLKPLKTFCDTSLRMYT